MSLKQQTGRNRKRMQIIMREYRRPVIGILRRLGVEDSNLDDVHQEVFIVVHRHLDAQLEVRSMKSWIYGICRRCAANHRRKLARRVEQHASSLTQAASGQMSVPNQEQRASLDSVRRCIRQLDPDKQDVILLYCVEGRPMQEVAAMLRIPTPTAYSRLRAARVELLRQVGNSIIT